MGWGEGAVVGQSRQSDLLASAGAWPPLPRPLPREGGGETVGISQHFHSPPLLRQAASERQASSLPCDFTSTTLMGHQFLQTFGIENPDFSLMHGEQLFLLEMRKGSTDGFQFEAEVAADFVA